MLIFGIDSMPVATAGLSQEEKAKLAKQVKVDRVEFDPDLSSLEDDGRGSVQVGQCELVTH